MIKLKIEKLKEFTPEERKEYFSSFDRGGISYGNNYNELPAPRKYVEVAMEVEVTEEQWESIRKAVIEKF